MVPFTRTLFVLLLGALPAAAQSPSQLKSELKTKEAAAKKDPDALFEVGQWAAAKALAADAKRIYQAVLKLKPDHPGANEALGFELVADKWVPAKEAEALRKKARAAEFAAKGYVDVGGVWVEADKVDDAKRGIFHHDGQRVTKDEALALQAGGGRHPDTGELIDARHLEKAQNKYYPIGNEGRWVDLKEADTYHSDVRRAWVVRTENGTIISTLGLAKIQELAAFVEEGLAKVAPLFAGRKPPPALRPTVLVAATESEYRDWGTEFGAGWDAAGVFLAPKGAITVRGFGDTQVAICDNHKDWGPRRVRHGAAMAHAAGIAAEAGAELPAWLLNGIGAYTSRFQTDSDAGWFGKQHMQKGGVSTLRTFFPSFAISGDMEPKDIDFNVFQAGLCVAFAVHGGDEKVTQAMQGVAAVLQNPVKGALAKAVKQLEQDLAAAEPKIVAYLNELIAKAPQ
jgi:hypothetical protein